MMSSAVNVRCNKVSDRCRTVKDCSLFPQGLSDRKL